jgi:hypothetical protein
MNQQLRYEVRGELVVFPFREDIEDLAKQIGMNGEDLSVEPIPLTSRTYLQYASDFEAWILRSDASVARDAWNHAVGIWKQNNR